jgi:hypothetical protein
MKMRIAGLLVVVLAVMLVPAALPQMEPTPVVYTYVSQFQIPRANWAAYFGRHRQIVRSNCGEVLADGTFLAGPHSSKSYTHPTDIRTVRRGRPIASRGS